ncbi:MAG: DegV family protein [Clostridia bacterium]|nr:DegV family protein [Clostridia bacterium]
MNILVDSCCDLSPELLKRTGASVAPLTITLDGVDYLDDGSVDIPSYIEAMRACKSPARSACPAVTLYAQEMERDGDCLVVTLSSKLSGSHNAALIGRDMALESVPGKRIHVFDSESASAGETYLALMLRDLIDAGKSFDEIVSAVEEKIRSLHTLFVLDSLDNLVKNGRVSRAVALIAGVLSIRLVMSDDGSGAIKQIGKARGIKAALAQMVDTCRKHTEGLAAGSQRLVLSYCNCLERAKQVQQLIRETCPAIGEIVMTPTSALSSMYAYDGGIVIAY